jgi:hypothetical protein
MVFTTKQGLDYQIRKRIRDQNRLEAMILTGQLPTERSQNKAAKQLGYPNMPMILVSNGQPANAQPSAGQQQLVKQRAALIKQTILSRKNTRSRTSAAVIVGGIAGAAGAIVGVYYLVTNLDTVREAINPNPDPTAENASQTAIIVGIITGTLALLFLMFYLRNYIRRKTKKDNEDDEKTDAAGAILDAKTVKSLQQTVQGLLDLGVEDETLEEFVQSDINLMDAKQLTAIMQKFGSFAKNNAKLSADLAALNTKIEGLNEEIKSYASDNPDQAENIARIKEAAQAEVQAQEARVAAVEALLEEAQRNLQTQESLSDQKLEDAKRDFEAKLAKLGNTNSNATNIDFGNGGSSDGGENNGTTAPVSNPFKNSNSGSVIEGKVKLKNLTVSPDLQRALDYIYDPKNVLIPETIPSVEDLRRMKQDPDGRTLVDEEFDYLKQVSETAGDIPDVGFKDAVATKTMLQKFALLIRSASNKGELPLELEAVIMADLQRNLRFIIKNYAHVQDTNRKRLLETVYQKLAQTIAERFDAIAANSAFKAQKGADVRKQTNSLSAIINPVAEKNYKKLRLIFLALAKQNEDGAFGTIGKFSEQKKALEKTSNKESSLIRTLFSSLNVSGQKRFLELLAMGPPGTTLGPEFKPACVKLSAPKEPELQNDPGNYLYGDISPTLTRRLKEMNPAIVLAILGKLLDIQKANKKAGISNGTVDESIKIISQYLQEKLVGSVNLYPTLQEMLDGRLNIVIKADKRKEIEDADKSPDVPQTEILKETDKLPVFTPTETERNEEENNDDEKKLEAQRWDIVPTQVQNAKPVIKENVQAAIKNFILGVAQNKPKAKNNPDEGKQTENKEKYDGYKEEIRNDNTGKNRKQEIFDKVYEDILAAAGKTDSKEFTANIPKIFYKIAKKKIEIPDSKSKSAPENKEEENTSGAGGKNSSFQQNRKAFANLFGTRGRPRGRGLRRRPAPYRSMYYLNKARAKQQLQALKKKYIPQKNAEEEIESKTEVEPL